jgi:hypothetical protein
MYPRPRLLDGVSLAELRSRLSALQSACLDLQAGKQVATATYVQGDGTKSVTYRQTDVGALTQAIISVQTQIDIAVNGVPSGRRAPITPIF